jgi:hypothetical protein
LVESHQIDREREEPLAVTHDASMPIVVERRESVDKGPDLRVGRMEDMGAVAMNFHAIELFAEAIPSDVRTPIDHQGAPPRLGHAPREDAAEHASANDHVVKDSIHRGCLIDSTFGWPRASPSAGRRGDRNL